MTSGERASLGEKYYHQVTESMNSLFELTTRIDERQQAMMKNLVDLENKFDNFVEQRGELGTRVKVLESQEDKADYIDKMKQDMHTLELRLHTLEISSTKSEGRTKSIIAFVAQLMWVIIAAYLLLKLGLQAPAVP